MIAGHMHVTDNNDSDFDDAMLRARSEQEVLPPGSDSAKVRAGQIGEFEFSEGVKRRFESLWSEHLLVVTGYQTYGDLIADLKR